jgi:MoaA/NifB/PqqE/SkfB family radical SAM enzyme
MSTLENKSFCALAWTHISTDTDGSVRPCCVSTDFIKKENRDNYNLGTDSITTIYNSPDYIQLRQDMVDGKTIPGCSRCYSQEESGSKSYRQQYNEQYPVVSKSIVVDPVIKYFDLRFGNLCNLNCRSCSPKSSSQLSKEVELMEPQILKFHQPYKQDINSWYQTKTYEDNLESQLHNVDTFYLTGGEPTLVEQNFQLMQLLIDRGLSKNVTIKLNSNMTNDKPRFFSLLNEFKKVIFLASIDGFGPMQEYLRYPSKWSQIDKNINRLLDKDLSNIVIVPTPTIQITNLGKITELFEYFEQFNRQARSNLIQISPIILEYPRHSSVENLPLEYKQQCWNRIADWISGAKYQPSTFHDSMNSIKFKCHTDFDYKLNDFFEVNDLFDQHRNSYLRDVNPELDALRAK